MDSAQVTTVVEPVVESHGLEVDRIEVVAAGKRQLVRIFLDGDGPEGRGPSLDQIAEATRSISNAMDEADLTRGRAYVLEVSSRGVGRPLTEAKHYRRNQGRLVALSTTEGELCGRITGIADDAVELDIDGSSRAVPLAAISKALVQVEMNRPGVQLDEEED
ncbi:ribosome maturation factor RimP [Propionicimonas paludicola]|uniref:Ribosome maturation factor RimP n=1 Tax=Propionicimonas paludicola TaxID=185243 RepID=A0A2A9CPY9_9ACTN|nr:ribosome maturation factor RimP [Propionicimonas paludicola]PFG16408.1 ribosome maturation factor RimP [Propionicimonas paludicola]